MTESLIAEAQMTADGPVALVIHRRIADEGYADFARWNGKVDEQLKAWPGFLGQELIPPQPPANVDWVQVQHFTTPAAARDWLQSDIYAQLLNEIRSYFVGQEDLHILPGSGLKQQNAVSAIISFKVPAELEGTFLAWQQRIQAAEAKFKGFLRHKVERPIPGLHDDWIIILSFDNDANLSVWLDSPIRQQLLKEGRQFNAGMTVKKASYGFNFWFPDGQSPQQSPSFIFKCNLLVLLVLYPVVYLWGYFIRHPLIDAHGVPFWLSLFIGNLVSTQLLGWWLVPAAFKIFDWWLASRTKMVRQISGYLIVIVLYGLSMALFAFLIAWNWGQGSV